MAKERPRRFRVTGTDRNGDVHAFETDNRDRAKAMLEEFKKRFQDPGMDTQRWI